MKKPSTLFLKLLIIIIGIGAVAAMLFLPTIEGRNADATLTQVYLNDPFLWFVYIASIPFFIALYQAFKLLTNIDKNRVFSKLSIKAVKNIKYCALSLIGFIAMAEVFILLNEEEDKAGGIAMGIFVAFGSIVIAALATVFQKLLENATDIKSENELTI